MEPSKIVTFVERGSRVRFSAYVEVYGPRVMGRTLGVIEFRATGKMHLPAKAFFRDHLEDFIGVVHALKRIEPVPARSVSVYANAILGVHLHKWKSVRVIERDACFPLISFRSDRIINMTLFSILVEPLIILYKIIQKEYQYSWSASPPAYLLSSPQCHVIAFYR